MAVASITQCAVVAVDKKGVSTPCPRPAVHRLTRDDWHDWTQTICEHHREQVVQNIPNLHVEDIK